MGMVKNERGYSLIEIMVSAGLMMIIALGAASLISSQNREMQSVTERLKLSELKTSVSQVLSNSTFCSCFFRGRTFDTTTNQWSPAISSIPEAYTAVPAFPGACTASGVQVVPTVGQLIPGSSVLRVATLQVVNPVEVAFGTGNYTAKINVTVNGSIRSMRGVESAFVFNIDPAGGVATARPFISCSGGAGGTGTLINCAWTAYGCTPSCPANKIAVGLRSNPPFNEDCGGGGNDYDEPSRSLNFCEIQL
jgi:type II secretory pathway pseudopilin PulG